MGMDNNNPSEKRGRHLKAAPEVKEVKEVKETGEVKETRRVREAPHNIDSRMSRKTDMLYLA